jgi:hypothetical protein
MRQLYLLVLLILVGCPTREPASPNPPVPPDTDLCPQMCDHLRRLKCEESTDFYDNDKPGPKGVPNSTCEEFCSGQQDKGVFVNPRCVAKVPDCASIETYRKKQPTDKLCAL